MLVKRILLKKKKKIDVFRTSKKKPKSNMETELQFLVKNFLNFHLNWKNFLGQNYLTM